MDQEKIQQIDQRIRKQMTLYMALTPSDVTDRQYV